MDTETLQGTLGPYALTEKLGQGGNGEVWRAKGPNGEVALKRLKKRPPWDGVQRFLREIEALNRLKTVAGVLPILDADPTAATWYVMPIATTLKAKLASDATLQETCAALGGIASALSRVHALGIAHRDIKPDNLYWHEGQWCVGDFGLADFEDAEPLTRSDRKLGPAHYIAPEMLNSASNADGRLADIYSLGKTIWVLATGQTFPFPGVHDPTHPIAKVGTYRNDRRATLLDELIRRMTQFDPIHRPQAEAVARELTVLAEDEPSGSVPLDPTTALNALRAALVPHVARAEVDAHQQKIAEENAERVEEAIFRLVQDVRRTLPLEDERWFEIPEYWRHSGSRSMEKCGAEKGYCFEAGGEFMGWRLAIGMKWQLFSDGLFALTAGYHIDRLVLGNKSNVSGGPQPWVSRIAEPNGSGGAAKAIGELIAGLECHFAEMVELFARLVAEQSK